MDIRGVYFCDIPATSVRDALKAFIELPIQINLKKWPYKIKSKRLTADFISKQLSLNRRRSERLLSHLIDEGYIDRIKRIPTPLGMALASAVIRPRISRQKAEQLLDRFLNVVERENGIQKRRVHITKVYVFGSFLTKSQSLGDIDLIIFFSMPKNCNPEDFDERDALSRKIQISKYLSFSDQFDITALNAFKELIYER